MVTAIMIRVDSLKLPLHILRAMILNDSDGVVSDLKMKHQSYLRENCPSLAQQIAAD